MPYADTSAHICGRCRRNGDEGSRKLRRRSRRAGMTPGNAAAAAPARNTTILSSMSCPYHISRQSSRILLSGRHATMSVLSTRRSSPRAPSASAKCRRAGRQNVSHARCRPGPATAFDARCSASTLYIAPAPAREVVLGCQRQHDACAWSCAGCSGARRDRCRSRLQYGANTK